MKKGDMVLIREPKKSDQISRIIKVEVLECQSRLFSKGSFDIRGRRIFNSGRAAKSVKSYELNQVVSK